MLHTYPPLTFLIGTMNHVQSPDDRPASPESRSNMVDVDANTMNYYY